MTMPRRRFLQLGAAAVGTLGAARAARAAGPDYDLQGLDVSNYQGYVDWAAVAGSDRRYAFCKATEGVTFTDARFASNWANMLQRGVLRGAYHYGRPNTDPVAQADHFIAVVKPKPGDLKMVLDIETADGKTPAQVRAWVVAFVARLVDKTGNTPLMYTGFYFWRDSAGNGSNLDCPLWLAQYNTAPTLIPAAWPTWTFWQYTSSGSCPGVGGNVDLNAFNGTKTALNKMRMQ